MHIYILKCNHICISLYDCFSVVIRADFFREKKTKVSRLIIWVKIIHPYNLKIKALKNEQREFVKSKKVENEGCFKWRYDQNCSEYVANRGVQEMSPVKKSICTKKVPSCKG